MWCGLASARSSRVAVGPVTGSSESPRVLEVSFEAMGALNELGGCSKEWCLSLQPLSKQASRLLHRLAMWLGFKQFSHRFCFLTKSFLWIYRLSRNLKHFSNSCLPSQNLHLTWPSVADLWFERLLLAALAWLLTSFSTWVKASTVPSPSAAFLGCFVTLDSPSLNPTNFPNSVFAIRALFSRKSAKWEKVGSEPISKIFPDSSAHFACMCTGRRITIFFRVSKEFISAW